MHKILEATAASIGTFSSQNLSNAVMAFAKLDHHPGNLMDSIATATISALDNATPQASLCQSLPPSTRNSQTN